MRPNKVGYGICGLFFTLGLVFLAVSKYTRLLGAIWVLMSLGLLWFMRRMEARAAAAIEFRKTALPAKARILEFTDTGMTFNEQPVLRFAVEVVREGAQPYRVEMKSVVPRTVLGQLTSGGLLQAWVDRADPQNVQLDWGTPAQHAHAGATEEEDPVERLRALEDLKDQGLISAAEYDEQRKRILSDI